MPFRPRSSKNWKLALPVVGEVSAQARVEAYLRVAAPVVYASVEGDACRVLQGMEVYGVEEHGTGVEQVHVAAAVDACVRVEAEVHVGRLEGVAHGFHDVGRRIVLPYGQVHVHLRQAPLECCHIEGAVAGLPCSLVGESLQLCEQAVVGRAPTCRELEVAAADVGVGGVGAQ